MEGDERKGMGGEEKGERKGEGIEREER